MYEFFILLDGEEVRDTAELVERKVDSKQQHMVSKDEPWIETTINLR